MTPAGSMNLFAFAAQAALIVALTRLTSFLDEINLYFRFSTLFLGSGSDFSIQALIIKLAIPFVSAFALVAGWTALGRGRGRGAAAPAEAVLSMQAGGFFSALLMAWPLVIHWEVLSAPALADQRGAFLFIYALYAVTYFFAAGAGAMLALRLLAPRLPAGEPADEAARASRFSWLKIGVEAFVSTLAGGVATFALGQVLPQ